MAAYVTLESFMEWVGQNTSEDSPGVVDQLSDREAPFNVKNETIIQNAINETGATIDTYLAGRYTLPITNTTDLLALSLANKRLAAFEIWSANGGIDQIPDRVLEARDETLDWLKMISTGKASLASAEASGIATIESGSWEQNVTESVADQL